MTPKQYLDRYTYLKFYSPWNFEQVPAGLTNYGSGKTRYGDCANSAQIEAERAAFTQALRKAHHGNASTPCGEKFFFNQKPLAQIKPTEDFYGSAIFRTFLGKGSPDEIIDTLRLAMAIGRIGMDKDANGARPARATAQAYVKSFVTLDCNGLAGNYLGVNSDGHISQFASPAKKRAGIRDVRVGDPVVTHCAKWPYEHVGLIDEWTPISDTQASVKIVEWGWHGGEDVHWTRNASTVTVTRGPEKTFGIGWATTSNKDKTTPSFRYVFAPPAGDAEPLGWF